MRPDPQIWFQRQPGGAWYRVAGGRNSYYIKVCEGCGQEALMLRESRFCSLSCAGKSDNPGYSGAHQRMRRDKGDPSQHVCTDCGQQAAEGPMTASTWTS